MAEKSYEDLKVDASNYYEQLLEEADEKSYKHGWVYHKLMEKYGVKIADEIWDPADAVEKWELEE